MRILVLGNVPPGVTGGAEVQAHLLSMAWFDGGHAVTVVGTDNFPAANGGLRVVRLPLWRASRLTRATSYLINTLLYLWRTSGDFDIVYCRFLREHALVASFARLVGILRCPVVACPASTSISGDSHAIMRSRFHRLWIAILRRSKITVNAMSAVIEGELLELGLESRQVSRIPNGVRLPDMVHPLDTVDRPRRLLFVGRLVWEKALDILLDALQSLAENEVRFELWLVGDGPLRDYVEDRIQTLALGRRVTMVGHVTREGIGRYYRDADIFVLSSRIEGMPGVLLEAMAHGLPVVSTRVSGAEEIVDEAVGWLVPVDDARAMSSALESALLSSSGNLARLGAAARARAAEVFDIEKVALKYIELFEELVSRQKDRAGQLGSAS